MIFDQILYVLMVVYIFWDIEFLKYVILAGYTVFVTVKIVRSVIYSRKVFVCLDCGEEFRMKLTELYRTYSVWGTAGTGYKVENGELRRLWVRCPKCGQLNVSYNEGVNNEG